jgi:hypothetical protein
MVAYSFQKCFAPEILDGIKRQTIRADRRRHARPGEEVQLYTGMRTKQCRLIGRAVCTDVQPIVLSFNDADLRTEGFSLPSRAYESERDPWGNERARDRFAVSDGFEDWSELRLFWRIHYPGVDRFEGVLIEWGGFHP